jgi:hypothetical protein
LPHWVKKKNKASFAKNIFGTEITGGLVDEAGRLEQRARLF